MNRPPGRGGRFIGPGQQNPNQTALVPRGYAAPQRPEPPQTPSPYDAGMGGMAGMGEPQRNYVTAPYVRQQVDAVERRMSDAFEALRGDVNLRLEDVIKWQPHRGVGNAMGDYDKFAGLGEVLRTAIANGRCQPYNLITDIAFEAGVKGERRFGGVIVDNAGPMFICTMKAYAFIDDPNASNFPFSLLNPPPCASDTPTNCPNPATSFTANCSTIIPTIDADGMFIPISPEDCKLIAAGTETCCFTETCPDGTVKQFSGKVPIVLLDHPECVDGITEVNLNGCLWDNVPFPLAWWGDNEINLCSDSPDCVGVCGLLDCQKQLDISLTLTRELRYNVDVIFMLSGFRIFTCT